VIGLPWVAGAGWFAAEPAVGGGVSDEFGSCLVVAFVVLSLVGSVGVDECLAGCGAGWAAGGVGGESSAVEAGSLDGHGGGAAGNRTQVSSQVGRAGQPRLVFDCS
jgi:hypothetical protein